MQRQWQFFYLLYAKREINFIKAITLSILLKNSILTLYINIFFFCTKKFKTFQFHFSLVGKLSHFFRKRLYISFKISALKGGQRLWILSPPYALRLRWADKKVLTPELNTKNPNGVHVFASLECTGFSFSFFFFLVFARFALFFLTLLENGMRFVKMFSFVRVFVGVFFSCFRFSFLWKIRFSFMYEKLKFFVSVYLNIHLKLLKVKILFTYFNILLKVG